MLWIIRIHPLPLQIVRSVWISIYESPWDICCKVKSYRLLRDQTGSLSAPAVIETALTGITALSNVLKFRNTVDTTSIISYTYTNYHRCVPEIPSSPNSINTSSILLHLYFERAWLTVRFDFFPSRQRIPLCLLSCLLWNTTPFPGALIPPWHGAVPGSLQGAPRNISSGAPGSRPPRPSANHRQNLQSRNTVVQLKKLGWESLYNRVA